ncbi:hypothetical protein D3C79_895810 [compost metagenome]
MADQLGPRGTQRLRRPQFGRIDRAHAGGGGDGNRGEDCQVDQQYLRQFTNAAPDHDQWQVGQGWNRAVELDQRIENAAGNPVMADRDADRNRRCNRRTQRQADTSQARPQVLPQGRLHIALGQQQPGLGQHGIG